MFQSMLHHNRFKSHFRILLGGLSALLACTAMAGPTQVPICKTDQSVPGDLETGNNYGASVAAETYAVVGAPEQDRFVSGMNLDDVGAAYVLKQSGSDWVVGEKLQPHPENPNLVQEMEHFGDAVDTDGDVIIVGAWGRDVGIADDAGAAYMFRRNDSTGDWEQEQVLTASDGNFDDHFGGFTDPSFDEFSNVYASRPQAVAVDGNLAVVGAADDDSSGQPGLTDTGSAYIFRYDKTGATPQWIEEQNIHTPDPQSGVRFGWSVDVDASAGRVVVGEPFRKHPDALGNEGRAYVFELDGSGQWVHEATFQAEVPMQNDAFGWSVSIDGNNIIVGAPSNGVNGEIGFATIFTLDNGVWQQEQTLTPLAPDDEPNIRFGYSAHLDGRSVLIGAIKRNDPGIGTDVGAAFMFTREPEQWTESLKILPDDNLAHAEDRYGISVALTGDNAFAGARTDEPASAPTSDDRGASYAYSDVPNCN